MDSFNADNRAAALNQGSYLHIPRTIRDRVNHLFEAFVADHIERRVSCAFETTLRSSITFEQAALARRAGFVVDMRYLALQTFAMHLERIKMRADMGGHSAPVSILQAIYESSIGNLPRAVREMDLIRVYDNSGWGASPALMLQAEKGEIIYRAAKIPAWLMETLSRL
ncbi:MAG: hypothetical protein ABSH32_23685 [Bryobacteraceae bacterium]